jgi:hypothetical protein
MTMVSRAQSLQEIVMNDSTIEKPPIRYARLTLPATVGFLVLGRASSGGNELI